MSISVFLFVLKPANKKLQTFFFLKNSHLPKNPLEKTEMDQKT